MLTFSQRLLTWLNAFGNGSADSPGDHYFESSQHEEDIRDFVNARRRLR